MGRTDGGRSHGSSWVNSVSSTAAPRTSSASPIAPVRDGVRVTVRLTPKAASDRILGVVTDDAGRPAVKAQVSAPPEDGKANAALVKLLAKACAVPRSSLAVVSGQTHRTKLVQIAGDPAELRRRLE